MKKLFRHIILFGFIQLLASSFAFAQKGIVAGRVRNSEGALPNATVFTDKEKALTDAEGKFSFVLDSGNHLLVVTHAGYQKTTKKIQVAAGNTQQLEIVLMPAETLGEVVVLGSRSSVQRSNLNTPVPVDVFFHNRLLHTGQISLSQMLNVAAPSLNASRELLNEPVTLRGLDPQHVLILVNGTRYHNMAWFYGGGLKGQLGRGSVGNDINSIPFSAVEKVEILRDGAAAQYGSDAIAGVINIRLKEAVGKTSFRLHTGQFYKGDGEKISFGFNRGFALNKKGFLQLSADFRYQEPTFRGGRYEGTVYRNYPANASRSDSLNIKAIDDSIVKARGFNRTAVKDNFGTLKIKSTGFLANGGYPINLHTKIFITVSASHRSVWRDDAYRFPKNPAQVNLALYPDGFQAKSHPQTVDISVIGGLKGETKNKISWAVISSYGRNAVDRKITNTNNPSQTFMGKDAPTAFYIGKQVYQQFTNNVHVTKKYIHSTNASNLALGTEWRVENYYTKAGDSSSWHNYDPTGRPQAGAGGIRPEDVVHKTRNVWGAYIELESEWAHCFLLTIAGRFEHYSDFGGNLAGKLAARYKFSEAFVLRASVNNGFRAPALQQRYHSSTQNGFIRLGPTLLAPAVIGTFPNDHAVTKALGIPSLAAEKSINVSAGATANINRRISMTLDAYWIQINNRVVLSNPYNKRDNASLDSILSRYPDLQNINQVSFFANAIHTRTYGTDLVINGAWNFIKSTLHYTIAANINRTKVFGAVQVPDSLPFNEVNSNILFNRADRAMIETGQPKDKVALTLNYQKKPFSLVLTNTRYGRTTVFHEIKPALDQSFAPKLLTDASVHYQHKNWMKVSLGANNIFNVYPDRIRYFENTNNGLLIYSPEASPFGFYGGYYFVALALEW